MHLKFIAEKNRYTKLFFLGFPVLLFLFFALISIINGVNSNADIYFGLFVLAIITLVILSFYYRTYYSIDNDKLMIVCGIFQWTIDIDDIAFIRLNQKKTGASRAASLTSKGIVVYWQKSKSIFISPENESRFLEVLCSVNKNIEIREGIFKPKVK